MTKIKILTILITIGLWTSSGFATTYYINSLTGNDNNIGTDLKHPLQTLSKVYSLPLKARDQVLLAAGQVFKGTLKLENRSGTAKHPIFISSYNEVASKGQLPQPIIDAKGFANGILLVNCNHIIVDGLEITANGGDIPDEPKPKQSMRCGVLVTTSTTGIFENIILQNLLIQDIFFENAGFQRGKDEVRGYRVKNKDGAFQEGKIFWLSGYAGKGKARTGPFNSYFYNNTIYVKKGIVAKIAIDRASSGIFIANNIFYVEGESKAVLGDQYKPEKAGVSQVKDVVFQNNLYLNANNWPDEILIQDAQPLFGDPGFAQVGGNSSADYSPTHAKILKNKGIPITPLPNDSIGLYLGLKVKRDFFGNKIKGKPDLGAIEFKNKRNDE